MSGITASIVPDYIGSISDEEYDHIENDASNIHHDQLSISSQYFAPIKQVEVKKVCISFIKD